MDFLYHHARIYVIAAAVLHIAPATTVPFECLLSSKEPAS